MRRFTSSRAFRALLLLLALVGSFGVAMPDAFAQTRPPPVRPVGDRVSVDMMVVHATNAHTNVDPRLEGLRRQLSHLAYTGYSVLDTRTESLGDGQETTMAIAGGRRLRISLLDHDATSARMRVRMFKDSDLTLDTTVTVSRNRSFIVAGPKYDGGVLLVPLTANY